MTTPGADLVVLDTSVAQTAVNESHPILLAEPRRD